MGLCPACGHYMTTSKSASPEIELDSDDSQWIWAQAAVPVQKKLVTKQQKKNRIQWIFTVVLILLMVGYYLSVKYVRLPRDIKTAYDYQRQGESKVITGTVDEIFDINGSGIEIGGLTDFILEGIEAPKGWQYVQVPFQMFSDDLSYTQQDALLVYLYIDGYYAVPLSAYQFPEYEYSGSMGSLSLNSETFYTHFEATLYGKFVFLIPKEVTEAKFYIYQREAIPDYTRTAVRLECIYEFDMKGVE